ncbi:MAG TPA: cytochrome c oxidase accessory protein CcoG, partial [Labilithrix sp.]|nr:cytochrome c oxidase accessory protein CcoG [Labilithrix sp.]
MRGPRRLPILEQPAPTPGGGSLGKDGRRRRPYPADVSGRWVRARRLVYFALVAIWAALPWIRIGGNPAVFLDVERRQFFLFGATFNAQDIWLLFFVVTGFGFGLLYVTALLGRVWCGWACPQTVFVEGIFRPIERLVNGSRNAAMERRSRPTSFDALWRLVVTHVLYVVAAAFAAHVFLAYFVSLPRLYTMVRANPSAHPEAFVWMLGSTALFYVAFGIFREQFCVVMCPYGRLQSVLLDDDSLVVGYDERRGEPRGKAKTEGRGDCVDCDRCVVVCPTGIDIREGLQLDCIACTACIDACDAVMDKLGQPRGLIRYDSLRGLRGEKRRIVRPTVVVYTVLLAIGVVAATLAVRARDPFEANVLRLPGAPYTRDGDKLRNGYELHLVNKGSKATMFVITSKTAPDLDVIVPMQNVEVEPLGSRRVPFFVTMEAARFTGDRPVVVQIEAGGVHKDVKAVFLGGSR